MQKFFFTPDSLCDGVITLTGENAHHISYSLRMAVGDRIVLCDGEGNDRFCTITKMTGDSVVCTVDEKMPSQTEPPYKAVLYQSVVKGEKMDYIVQKAVELGVSEIVPVESARCIVKLNGESREKKRARWQKISLEAAKQCGRGIIPKVSAPISFAQAVEKASQNSSRAFICYENEEGKTIADFPRGEEYIFFVGPEGGFDDNEILLCRQNGIESVSLGKRILRAESASGFVLSCLSYREELLK